MADGYQQLASLLSLSLANDPKFKRPMSKKARKLFEGMLGWSSQFYPGKIWANIHDFAQEFADVYDPILYEEACHKYRTEIHVGTLKKRSALPGTFKTKEDILNAMALKHFEDHAWIKANSLADNNKRIKVLSSPEARRVYEWLTANFLVTDFSEDDLNKLAMLGDEKFNLNTIKSEAGKITDIQKHSIAYLYAIVRDISLKEEYASRQAKEIIKIHSSKMEQLVKLEVDSKNKLVHEFDEDMRSKWEHDREFIDIMRDIKKDS